MLTIANLIAITALMNNRKTKKMKYTKHITHKRETINGQILQNALNKVSDFYLKNAYMIRKEDRYADHVTEQQKDEYLLEGLEFASSVKSGNKTGFSVWQRVNTEITCECVTLLPK